MTNVSSKDKRTLLEAFTTYKKKFKEISKKNKVDNWTWSNGDYISLIPLEIERSDFKKGKELKAEPKKKSNVVAYGFKKGKLCIVLRYGKQFLTTKILVVHQGNKTIYLHNYDETDPDGLYNVNILFSDDDNKPLQCLLLNIDDDDQTIIKEKYQYQKNRLIKIDVQGYIQRSYGKIKISRDYEIEYNDRGDLKKIVSNEYELTTKRPLKTKVYPK